jgi:hypothetical protein
VKERTSVEERKQQRSGKEKKKAGDNVKKGY